jgi:maleylacetoacetate isomerase
MSGKPHLYGYFFSSTSLRIISTFHLKGIPFEYTAIDLKAEEEYAPEFSKINPSNAVPAMVHNGKTFTQSMAILEYLEDVFPNTQKLLPKDAGGRARVRALANIIACDIHPVNNLRVLKKLGDFGLSLKEARGDKWYHHWILNGFTAFEKHLADPETGNFCHGDAVTFADICLIPQVHNAHRFGTPMETFPNIQRIFNNCMALEAFQKSSPQAQPDSPTAAA